MRDSAAELLDIHDEVTGLACKSTSHYVDLQLVVTSWVCKSAGWSLLIRLNDEGLRYL